MPERGRTGNYEEMQKDISGKNNTFFCNVYIALNCPVFSDYGMVFGQQYGGNSWDGTGSRQHWRPEGSNRTGRAGYYAAARSE